MNILVKRVARKEAYTIGKMYIDGKYFCDTLEDKDRGLRSNLSIQDIKRLKVPSCTAIPIGTYKVIVNRSPKFGRLLPRLINVPGFDGILIHRGNTSKDTSGCILVGENKVVGKVINSATYEKELTKIISKAQSLKEDITITIE